MIDVAFFRAVCGHGREVKEMKKKYIFASAVSKLSGKKVIRFKWCT